MAKDAEWLGIEVKIKLIGIAKVKQDHLIPLGNQLYTVNRQIDLLLLLTCNKTLLARNCPILASYKTSLPLLFRTNALIKSEISNHLELLNELLLDLHSLHQHAMAMMPLQERNDAANKEGCGLGKQILEAIMNRIVYTLSHHRVSPSTDKVSIEMNDQQNEMDQGRLESLLFASIKGETADIEGVTAKRKRDQQNSSPDYVQSPGLLDASVYGTNRQKKPRNVGSSILRNKSSKSPRYNSLPDYYPPQSSPRLDGLHPFLPENRFNSAPSVSHMNSQSPLNDHHIIHAPDSSQPVKDSTTNLELEGINQDDTTVPAVENAVECSNPNWLEEALFPALHRSPLIRRIENDDDEIEEEVESSLHLHNPPKIDLTQVSICDSSPLDQHHYSGEAAAAAEKDQAETRASTPTSSPISLSIYTESAPLVDNQQGSPTKPRSRSPLDLTEQLIAKSILRSDPLNGLEAQKSLSRSGSSSKFLSFPSSSQQPGKGNSPT